MKIAEYIFNAEVDTLPDFNSGFEYTYSDTNNDDGTITRIIESDTRPSGISFTSKTGLLRLNEIDMSNVTTAYAMFMNCSNLTYVKITNVSKCIELQGMFYNCTNLETIEGIEQWDTSHNISCAAMFSGCKKLRNLDISNLNMSNVQAMGAMFRNCSELTELDFSKWKTPNVQYVSGMFTSCTGLTKLDLSSFNTENFGESNQVVTMCSNLVELNLSNWILNGNNSTRLDNPANKLSVTYFFNKTNNINKLIMENTNYFTVDKIISVLPTKSSDSMGTIILSMEEDLDDILRNKASAKYWNIEYEKKEHIYTVISYVFDPSISDLLPSFNEEFVDYTYEDVQLHENTLRTIKSKQLPTKIKFGTNNLDSNQASSLISVSQCNAKELNDCANMFKNCVNLKYATILSLNNYKIKDIHSMFEGCINYASTVGSFFEQKIADARNLFKGCVTFLEADLRYIRIAKNTKIEGIFENCTSLNSIRSNSLVANNLIEELPNKTLHSYGKINLTDSGENIEHSEELTKKHWYADGINNLLDLFVVMGQSNAQGQSETYKEFNVPDYQAVTYEYLTDSVVQVKHPFGENINTLGDAYELGYYQLEGAVGCETGLPYGSLSPHFAAKYYEKTKRPILIEPCCCGASQVKEWLPGHAQGRYELTVEKVNKSVNAVTQRLGRQIAGKYLIWLQGESDGIYRTGTKNYKTRFLQLWNALKEDLGFEKCFIIRVAKFRPDKYNDKPIIEAQEQLALENDDIELVTRVTGYLEYPTQNPINPGIQDYYTEGYPYIDHYTWEGYRIVGETTGERVANYINHGFIPDLEPEPYIGEITSSSENLIMDYKFDNTVDSNFLPTFNENYEGTLRMIDVTEESITRRKVIATEIPSKISFNNSLALKEVLNINITNVVDAVSMFEGCKALTSIKFGNKPTPKLLSMERMFYDCQALLNIDFNGMTTENLEFLSATFSNCLALETLDIGDWDVRKVTSLAATFRYSSKLVNLDLSKWKIDNLLYASGTFRDCKALKHIDLSGVKAENLITADQLFYNCTGLISVDISAMKIPPSCACNFVFGLCSNLTTIDISNININSGTKKSNIFKSSPKIKHIGMLYCNEETCNTIKNEIANVKINTNIYIKDTKAEAYANNTYVNFINYKNKEVEILLPQQLTSTDKLYWDEDKKRYYIDINGNIIETGITKRLLFKIYNPNTIIYVKDSKVLPLNLSIKVPKKGE